MEEIKIGEIFQVGRTRLRCVKGVGCKNCFFLIIRTRCYFVHVFSREDDFGKWIVKKLKQEI